MNPHYLIEDGIRPWRGVELSHSHFSTITVMVSKLSELPPILNSLFPALSGRFVHWFVWFTMREVFEGNVIQKRKLTAELSADMGRFRNPVVRLNDRIISKVSSIEMPMTALELDILSDYRRQMMIGSADSAVTSENLSLLMASHSDECDARVLAEMLAARTDLIFCLCFDDGCTHAAFQWLGHGADLRLLERALIELNIEFAKSREDVAEILCGH